MTKKNKYTYNIPDLKGGSDPESNAKTFIDRSTTGINSKKRKLQVA